MNSFVFMMIWFSLSIPIGFRLARFWFLEVERLALDLSRFHLIDFLVHQKKYGHALGSSYAFTRYLYGLKYFEVKDTRYRLLCSIMVLMSVVDIFAFIFVLWNINHKIF